MKAWRIEKHGGPEVLAQKEIPDPKPGPLKVCLKVRAVGLNHLDLWARNGVPGHRFPLPLTPGCDIVGEITELGAGAKEALATLGVVQGASVIVNPGLSCGICMECLGGFDPLCKSYGIFGETTDGGCADQVVVPVANLIPRPKDLSEVDAACLPIPFLTAWTMLHRKANIQPGETVLIQAGGSAVSVAAIQIAKLLGATVITTVGSAGKAEKAREIGADHVILYRETSFREEVREILGKRRKKGCEVVLDHVGATTFQDSLKCLAWGGRLVTCGATSGAEIQVDLKPIFFKNISILGSTMGSKADLVRIVDLVAQKKLKAIVSEVFPMDDLPRALKILEDRKSFGKVVLVADRK